MYWLANALSGLCGFKHHNMFHRRASMELKTLQSTLDLSGTTLPHVKPFSAVYQTLGNRNFHSMADGIRRKATKITENA